MSSFTLSYAFTAAALIGAAFTFQQSSVARAAEQPPKVTNTVCLTPPPPSDADVLFDGTAESLAKAWVPTRANHKIWPVQNEIAVAANTDIRTKKSYGDCQLHIEWRVPANRHADGQRGANSGVIFMDGRYEVQILESHTNKTYIDGMAGALYNKSAPATNPSRPKGEWQSYDIALTVPRFDKSGKQTSPARFTVIYNGVVVQLNKDLSGSTRHRDSKPQAHPLRLPLILQFHGDPIEFRNIWIRDLDKKTAAPTN
ncbi:MAG: DUF1080 domain-containing protein [Puniceicoccales bacterium]|jgi:hypothetical protein|nr:DUF1080 domain-containing protein [Puniceicoccales bacterium]